MNEFGYAIFFKYKFGNRYYTMLLIPYLLLYLIIEEKTNATIYIINMKC